jgi:molybdenum ABC transporter molybdate-binding protein
MRHLLRRPGRLNGPWLAFLASAVVFVVLVAALAWTNRSPEVSRTPITVYCAAGLRPPVEAIARKYEQRYGIPIHLQYGPSQTLLSTLEVAHSGDLYLAADEQYLQLGRDKGLLDESIPLAYLRPMLAVAKGNPKKIASLADLLRPEVRVVQADKNAAIGKIVSDALGKSETWPALEKRSAFTDTVMHVADDLKIGAADAGFLWNANLAQYPELEAVTIPELKGRRSTVPVAVVRATKQPSAALRFARFLASSDEGLPEFSRAGYEIADGDTWVENPEVKLQAGAMLRPAIQQTIEEFERREGVRVLTKFDGCGILVSGMRAGDKPDAFFACDQSFMEQVHDLFLDGEGISRNRLVIVVKKGNPFDIHTLDDLATKNLRVGVGNEKQCALGVLTDRAFEEGKVKSKMMKNVRVWKPTGDQLITDMLAGSLDAVVAYVSNAAGHEDELETLPIKVACAEAVQPVAVARASTQKHLTGRLLDAIRTQESRERFEKLGFTWEKAPSKP